MELVVGLWFLYVLQCVTWLPGGAVLFMRPIASWLVSRGPGWRMLHPLPSAASFRAAHFPLVEVEGVLRTRGRPTWWASQGIGECGEAVSLEELKEATVRDDFVMLRRRRLARAASAVEAEALAALLRQLGRASDDERAGCVELALSESLSRSRYEGLRERANGATRLLGWISDTYAVCLLAALPLAMLLLGSERSLYLMLPLIAGLHLVTLVSFGIAHRRLNPVARGERVEALLAAAFYPPLLLRGHQALRSRALGTFHPALVAAMVLPSPERERALRTELLRAMEHARTEGVLGLSRCELRAVRTFVAEAGMPDTDLLAPPQRRDAHAASYCAACLCEYQRSAERCTDCGGPVVAYPKAVARPEP